MKKKKFTIDKMTFVAFTIIPLILYTFFYFISVSSGIYYSLTDWNGLNREYNFVGIANYIALSKMYLCGDPSGEHYCMPACL